jgi:hypothetical protein
MVEKLFAKRHPDPNRNLPVPEGMGSRPWTSTACGSEYHFMEKEYLPQFPQKLRIPGSSTPLTPVSSWADKCCWSGAARMPGAKVCGRCREDTSSCTRRFQDGGASRTRMRRPQIVDLNEDITPTILRLAVKAEKVL